jgi:hypothetical protein
VTDDFAVDLHCVVLANHAFTIEGINRAENEDFGRMKAFLPKFPQKMAEQVVVHMRNTHYDLRQAATHLAVVGLVTRFQHWTGKFVQKLGLKPDKASHSLLVSQLEILNRTLGEGPIPILFFEELTVARDSIVHADARAEWHYRGGNKKVAERYCDTFGAVDMTEEHFKSAVEKAIEQLLWYNAKLQARAQSRGRHAATRAGSRLRRRSTN